MARDEDTCGCGEDTRDTWHRLGSDWDTRPGHGGDSEAELVWPESACGSLFHVAPGAGAGVAMPRVTCAPLTLLLAGAEPPGAVGRARGADETRGDGDEGAGGEHAQHAAQQHRHPLHRLLLHHLHQHMYIYSTVYLVSSVTWSCLVQQNLSSGVPQQKMLALSSEAGQ